MSVTDQSGGSAFIQNSIKNLPTKPGVYRFYNQRQEIIYIGKAKNLKNRVSSYFQQGRPKNQRLTIMISQIYRLDYTVTKTEKEALLLEANLIYKHQPKYNVLLKNQQNYSYIRVTSDPIPTVTVVRSRFDPKSIYYGPFNNQKAWNLVKLVRQIFPFCSKKTTEIKIPENDLEIFQHAVKNLKW